MAKISNSPTDATVLQLEQRKSFALGLQFRLGEDLPADLTGSALRMTVGRAPEFPGADPVVLFQRDAVLVSPERGVARIDLQAVDLNLAEGNYPFTITMVTPSLYSGVVVKGEIVMVFNPESESLADNYPSVDPTNILDIVLMGSSVNVNVGHMIFAETYVYTSAEKEKLAAIEPGAQVNVNPDWNAVSGDGAILNKPHLGEVSTLDLDQLFAMIYPVGSVYVTLDPTSPGVSFGGTWERIGHGRALVGVDENDYLFNEPGKTSGSKQHLLTAAQSGLRAHTHTVTDTGHTHVQNAHNHTQDAHTHVQNAHSHAVTLNIQHSDGVVVSGEALTAGLQAGGRRRYNDTTGSTTATNQNTVATNQPTTATNQTAYTGVAINNVEAKAADEPFSLVQPSLAVYMWKRTA